MTIDLQRTRAFLAECAPGGVLVAGITGAHFYGFPSPDSDVDLKGVHVAPTEQVVGLQPPRESVDFLGLFDGQEFDYTSHELGAALRLLLKGNGNLLERLLTPLQVVESAAQQELQALARGAVARRFYHHYRGFFGRACEEVRAHGATLKRLLYAYRVALTGSHLLATGECVGDLGLLAPQYGLGHVSELIERKRCGPEQAPLADSARYEQDWPVLEVRLREAFERSTLPETPPNAAALSDFLLRQRRAHFA